jgi:class 3 adenylate cyclase
MQNYYRLFVPMAVLSLLFYIAMAFRFSYAGLELGMPLKLKLAGILGLIICLPISGTGILTFLGLSGSGRVLENHLLERTLNSIREFSLINHENLLGQVLAALEVKRRLEKTDKKNRNLKTVLAADDGTLNWYITYSNSINLTQDTGEQFQYNPSLDQANPNRLINSLLSKYTDSLGLSKVTRHQHGGHLTRTMTLGIMENYITPKMEEAWMVHESTVQREISHSSDTSRAIFYLVRDSNDDYILIYHRVCNNDEHVHRYLSWFNANQPFWFKKNGKYGDVMLGVRLRRYGSLFSFAWPTESLLSEDMNRIFEKAVAAKNFGHQIERKSGNIEARAWRWQEGESAVTAAFCQSKGAGIAGFAGSMLGPLLIGYAILLLFFITSIISEFISQPVKIIEAGVEQLKNERYGTLIASFSDDEFKHMTNAFNEMSNALRQREMIKRYVSGRLLQEVQTSSANHDAAAGQLEKVSILASDIRNFTSTSEKYSPAEIVDMLNSYFTLMEEAVKENGGVIDKYIGDAIQAIFYNDDSRENSAIRACRAAVDMRQRLNIFNQNRREAGLFTVENGIGIDTGMVISGSIGSEGGRKDFTVIGKATDIAARLESLTVNCNSRILISKATLNAAGPGLRTLDFDGEAEELLYD